MKKIIVILLTMYISLSACTGDCMSCHPALEKTILTDKRHSPMLTCIYCHKENSESMAECGPDCFVCHTKEKIDRPNVREHDAIEDCRICHMKLKREKNQALSAPETESKQAPLRDFLNNSTEGNLNGF